MLDPNIRDKEGLPLTCRAVFIVGPDKKLKLSLNYPASVGRNMDEIVRVVDALQLSAKYSVVCAHDPFYTAVPTLTAQSVTSVGKCMLHLFWHCAAADQSSAGLRLRPPALPRNSCTASKPTDSMRTLIRIWRSECR